MFGVEQKVLVKRDQLLIVEPVEGYANLKEERLKWWSCIAQDVISQAGSGFSDSFYSSSTLKEPEGYQHWNYRHFEIAYIQTKNKTYIYRYRVLAMMQKTTRKHPNSSSKKV